MNATAVLAPVAVQPAERVGRRLYRKQVLRAGEIDYKGTKINFDRAYLVELAAAFNDGAYDQVPFLLADRDNSHTLDPERMRGEVRGLVVTDDGLDALVELSEEGSKLVEANPRLGVSARIVENLSHADGRTFRKAIQHVLGTLDPRLTGMSPWQAVALSTDQIPVVDLSDATYNTGGPNMAEITDEELAEFQALRAEKLAQSTSPPTDDDLDPLTDEQIEAMLGDVAPEPVAVALSAETQAALEFAQAQHDQQAIELAAIRGELDKTRWDAERSAFLAKVPAPRVIDAARPLLEGSGFTVDLSNGTKADAGAVMRQVLSEVENLTAALNLSTEMGGRFATSGAPDQEAETKTLLEQFKAQYGSSR